MKILSVYYTEKPGGFCKRLYRLLNALAKEHEVHYAALDVPKTPLSGGVRFHRIPFWTARRSGLLFWATFIAWCPFYIAFLARRTNAERYVVFGAFYSAMLRVARTVQPAPLVLFIRSLVFEINRITGKPAWVRSIADAVDRLGIKNATSVVCMTEAMGLALVKFASTKPAIVVLPNDLPQPSAEKIDSRTLLPEHYENIALTSGVLDKRKNIEPILEAWKAATAEMPPQRWALIIAGDGSEKSMLMQRSRELGLSSVFFPGWVNNLDAYLASVQLVVHPSLHEGISNSILEAIANGAPVLVSNIPEHAEIFDSQALLVGAREWNSSLAAAVQKPDILATIRAETKKCGLKLNFDWDAEAVKMSTLPNRAITL